MNVRIERVMRVPRQQLNWPRQPRRDFGYDLAAVGAVFFVLILFGIGIAITKHWLPGIQSEVSQDSRTNANKPTVEVRP